MIFFNIPSQKWHPQIFAPACVFFFSTLPFRRKSDPSEIGFFPFQNFSHWIPLGEGRNVTARTQVMSGGELSFYEIQPSGHGSDGFLWKKIRFFPWFSNYLFVVGWGFGMVLTFFLGALMFDVENWNFTLVSYNYSIPGSTFQNCCKLLITVTAPWKNPSKWWRKLKLGSCK